MGFISNNGVLFCMKYGCVLSQRDICIEYDVACNGSEAEKITCPKWGVVMAAEKYYEKLLELDKDKYHKRL